MFHIPAQLKRSKVIRPYDETKIGATGRTVLQPLLFFAYFFFATSSGAGSNSASATSAGRESKANSRACSNDRGIIFQPILVVIPSDTAHSVKAPPQGAVTILLRQGGYSPRAFARSSRSSFTSDIVPMPRLTYPTAAYSERISVLTKASPSYFDL